MFTSTFAVFYAQFLAISLLILEANLKSEKIVLSIWKEKMKTWIKYKNAHKWK